MAERLRNYMWSHQAMKTYMGIQDQLIKHHSRVSVFKNIYTKTSLSHNSYLSFNNYDIR